MDYQARLQKELEIEKETTRQSELSTALEVQRTKGIAIHAAIAFVGCFAIVFAPQAAYAIAIVVVSCSVLTNLAWLVLISRTRKGP